MRPNSCHTEEAKEKNRQAHLGKQAWNKNKKWPEMSGKNHPKWKEKIRKICRTCKKSFYTKPSHANRRQHCSYKCRGIAQKGKHRSPKTEFKKGHIMSKETRIKISKNNSREKSHMWKGGRVIGKKCIFIYKPEHPFAMKSGYIREHRFVMEKYIKRFLKPAEVIHHINLDPFDNRIENLMLFKNTGEHLKYHRQVLGLVVRRGKAKN